MEREKAVARRKGIFLGKANRFFLPKLLFLKLYIVHFQIHLIRAGGGGFVSPISVWLFVCAEIVPDL